MRERRSAGGDTRGRHQTGLTAQTIGNAAAGKAPIWVGLALTLSIILGAVVALQHVMQQSDQIQKINEPPDVNRVESTLGKSPSPEAEDTLEGPSWQDLDPLIKESIMKSKPLQRMWEVLDKTQHPQDCSQVRLLYSGLPNGGFGMQLHWRALFLTYALLTNRTLAQHSEGYNYAIGALCQDGREPCYFGATSSCPANGISSAKLNSVDQKDRIVRVSNRVNQAFGNDAYIWPEEMFPEEMFPPDQLWKERRRWYRSAIMTYLTRPSAMTREFVEQSKKELGFETPCVAIHIRKGNHHREAAFHNDDEYINATLALLTRFDSLDRVNTILLMSDEQDNLISMPRDYPKALGPNTKYIFTEINRDYSTRKAELFLNRNWMISNGDRHNKDSVINLMLSRECEFFVGTMSSNWGRMVIELMAMIHSPNEDFMKWSSLDDNWYNNP